MTDPRGRSPLAGVRAQGPTAGSGRARVDRSSDCGSHSRGRPAPASRGGASAHRIPACLSTWGMTYLVSPPAGVACGPATWAWHPANIAAPSSCYSIAAWVAACSMPPRPPRRPAPRRRPAPQLTPNARSPRRPRQRAARRHAGRALPRLGAAVHLSTVCRAPAAAAAAGKKKSRVPGPGGPAPPTSGSTFRRRAPASTRAAASSSTRPGSTWPWAGCTAGPRGASGWSARCRNPIGGRRHWSRAPVRRPRGPVRLHRADGDAATFAAYVEQVLVPCLRPGDVVVLDRLQERTVFSRRRRGVCARWCGGRRSSPTSTRFGARRLEIGALSAGGGGGRRSASGAWPRAVGAITREDCRQQLRPLRPLRHTHLGYASQRPRPLPR